MTRTLCVSGSCWPWWLRQRQPRWHPWSCCSSNWWNAIGKVSTQGLSSKGLVLLHVQYLYHKNVFLTFLTGENWVCCDSRPQPQAKIGSKHELIFALKQDRGKTSLTACIWLNFCFYENGSIFAYTWKCVVRILSTMSTREVKIFDPGLKGD